MTSSRPPRTWLRAGAVSLLLALSSGCARPGSEATLAALRDRSPDLEEIEVGDGLAQAMDGYRQFLENAPESALTPEAMRRLADLALEKSYGNLGARAASTDATAALPAPKPAALHASSEAATPTLTEAERESAEAFESRAAANTPVPTSAPDDLSGAPEIASEGTGPEDALALYDSILERYPDYAYLDQVLYQKARALDELGRVDEAIAVADRLIAERPDSRHLDELLFRRGEYDFVRRRFYDAERSYASIVSIGPASDYYELALYKLGWSFYKQMFLEEALDTYIELLDHKVDTDYDFAQTEDEAEAQRVADTYRVISLCFSELGGAEAINGFFADDDPRPYEHRIYRELGEFFLAKLRYADAAQTYQSFTGRYPNHRMSPRFAMRIVETFEAGDFPKLVLEAKRDFAEDYGVASSYWLHNDLSASEKVLEHLEMNLRDLATHAHALYQIPEKVAEREMNFAEASRWYREYLTSFPTGEPTPGLHRRYADLLLEDRRFTEAAEAFETVAYDYPAHAQASEAGYAAVISRREEHTRATRDASEAALRSVVQSSLRFAETFHDDARAVLVLGAAAEDLYALSDHVAAIETAHRLIETYPEAERHTLRGAWLTVAHASFDRATYAEAEAAYRQVISLSGPDDEAVSENLAAAIYKQGELARAAGDPRLASDHFLRIADIAPNSAIRASAEYDAAAALIEVEDWGSAATVLESFRADHPDHALQRDVTRQMARVRESAGDLTLAAVEYERVADEADSSEARAEALRVAADLHEEAGDLRRALKILGVFVTEYTDPLERLVVARFKMAEIHGRLEEASERREQLRRIVALDANAGADRSPRVRGLAARSALDLAEPTYTQYAAIRLTQPFEKSLSRKKQSLERVVSTFESLVEYGAGDVTAAATFYIAEAYGEFGRSLLESERPADLSSAERFEYEDILEEQAYPFEERTIDLHEKNLELARTGVANAWIEKSLARLGALSPGRYAKAETSAGPIESLDAYVYRTPNRTQPAIEPGSPSDVAVVETDRDSTASEGLSEATASDPDDLTAAPVVDEAEVMLSAPAAIAPVAGDEEGAP